MLLLKYLLACVLLLFIISCEKTEIDPPEFPATLYLNRISIREKIRLYTDKREITDQNVIESFLKSNGGLRLKDSTFESKEYIQFFSPDSAAMLNAFSSLLVTKKDNQFIFKSTNKQIVSKEAIQSSLNMSKYRSDFEPVWDGKFSTYQMLVGYGNYEAIDLSVFEYTRVSWNTFLDPDYHLHPEIYKGVASGIRFNEFDEAYVNSLSKADTLAVREYFYSFKRN